MISTPIHTMEAFFYCHLFLELQETERCLWGIFTSWCSSSTFTMIVGDGDESHMIIPSHTHIRFKYTQLKLICDKTFPLFQFPRFFLLHYLTHPLQFDIRNYPSDSCVERADVTTRQTVWVLLHVFQKMPPQQIKLPISALDYIIIVPSTSHVNVILAQKNMLSLLASILLPFHVLSALII